MVKKSNQYWKQDGQVRESFKDSHPSRDTMKYFINTQIWSQEENRYFYFSFDESWKVGAEGSWRLLGDLG
jgi:hypothetical protein